VAKNHVVKILYPKKEIINKKNNNNKLTTWPIKHVAKISNLQKKIEKISIHEKN
jgi:hypothetical protein